MPDLKDFVRFVRLDKLNEFIEVNLEMLRALKMPLLDAFANLSQEDIMESMKRRVTQFLHGLESGTAIDQAKNDLSVWEADKIPGISKQQIGLPDIILGYYAQKAALIKFLPQFTQDSRDMFTIIQQLDGYYLEVHQLAMAALNRIEKQSQVKLQEKEERLKDLFDNASDLIHFATPEGNLLYANRAWQEALGYTTEDLKHTNIYDIVAPENKDMFIKYRSAVLENGENETTIVSKFRKKDGSYSTVEGFISCKFRNGKPAYTRAIMRDITKRQITEERLQFFTQQLLEREENFRHLIQNAPDAIIVINEGSIIQLWNPKAEELFGWKMEDVIGLNLLETIIPARYHEAHLSGMRRLITTGQSNILNRSVEISAMNKKGDEFYISLTISSSTSAGRKLFIAFLRDISVQKQNALELEERTKQLERTNLELEQFAWLTSHDLKEPLRKIMTFSDLLLSRHSDEASGDGLRYLQKINSSANRMVKLIDAILVYSNISSEKKLMEQVDLNKVLRGVLHDLEIAIGKRSAIISTDILPTIEAVPFQMRQLFQNLISNALKYTRPEIQPEISISSLQLGNGQVKITFHDNGIGFDNMYAEKIFQVFQRLETQDKYEGTGIGLAVCKKIVETHRGTINAESEEGQGSKFILILPVKQD